MPEQRHVQRIVNDIELEVLARPNAAHAFAARVGAADNLATRTLIDRHGNVTEESYACRGLVLWSGA